MYIYIYIHTDIYTYIEREIQRDTVSLLQKDLLNGKSAERERKVVFCPETALY